MKVYATQSGQRFLIVTGGDPKTRSGVGIIVDTKKGTVQRVKSVPLLLRQNRWQLAGESDPTVEQLVARVPALRPYRGIEVRLPTGETAWVRWGEWWSRNSAVQKRLAEVTHDLAVPNYEPDGDHFLATRAVAVLGGEVLDAPRAAAPPDTAY